MDDFGEELEEIKREIVESRSLTIKTNNLVNGLSAKTLESVERISASVSSADSPRACASRQSRAVMRASPSGTPPPRSR